MYPWDVLSHLQVCFFVLPLSLKEQKNGPNGWYMYIHSASGKVHNAEKRKVPCIQTNSAQFEGMG